MSHIIKEAPHITRLENILNWAPFLQLNEKGMTITDNIANCSFIYCIMQKKYHRYQNVRVTQLKVQLELNTTWIQLLSARNNTSCQLFKKNSHRDCLKVFDIRSHPPHNNVRGHSTMLTSKMRISMKCIIINDYVVKLFIYSLIFQSLSEMTRYFVKWQHCLDISQND